MPNAMGHVLYINVMGHMFYMNVIGPRVLYQRYEKCYMAFYLEGMNHIFCT